MSRAVLVAVIALVALPALPQCSNYAPAVDLTLTNAPLLSNAVFKDRNGNDVTFDSMVDAWRNDSRITRELTCSVAGVTTTCLFVPKYVTSHECGTNEVPKLDWTICNVPAGQHDANHFCMVTDEFSQVGMALAMRGNATSFGRWVNTVRAILGGDPLVPVWNVRVTNNGGAATIEVPSTDDASDATARILIALYVAAGSDAYGDIERRDYRLLADRLSRAFRRDFVEACSVSPCPDDPLRYWLASGQITARTSKPYCGTATCTDFSYAGYYGDAVIALLAARHSAISERDAYLDIAKDSVAAYFKAAKYSGASFAVPPKAFKWTKSGNTVTAECTNTCGAACNSKVSWDDSDAPRAISLCKAKYHADALGDDLGSLLGTYCSQWYAPAAFTTGTNCSDYKYSPQYDVDGGICSLQTSYFANALGATMHFAQGRQYFALRLEASLREHFDGVFDSAAASASTSPHS